MAGQKPARKRSGGFSAEERAAMKELARERRAPTGEAEVLAKVCFFQGGQKLEARYATLGFSDKAGLDDGAMWPTSYALVRLTAAEEARIVALVKRAVG